MRKRKDYEGGEGLETIENGLYGPVLGWQADCRVFFLHCGLCGRAVASRWTFLPGFSGAVISLTYARLDFCLGFSIRSKSRRRMFTRLLLVCVEQILKLNNTKHPDPFDEIILFGVKHGGSCQTALTAHHTHASKNVLPPAFHADICIYSLARERIFIKSARFNGNTYLYSANFVLLAALHNGHTSILYTRKLVLSRAREIDTCRKHYVYT